MPRKNAPPAEVLAALPRPRTAVSPDLPIPEPRPEPDPMPSPPSVARGLVADPKAPVPASDAVRGALRSTWRTVTGLLLIAFAVASVATMVTVMTQHLGFAPVLSPSMEPAFHPGDLVITKPEPIADLRVGQVVALPIPDSPGQRYVHRIISIKTKDGRPLVQTKGDANPTPENFTMRINAATVPRVVASVPYLGRASVLLQHTKTRLALMAVTIVAILLAAWRLLTGARAAEPNPAPRHVGRHRAIDTPARAS